LRETVDTAHERGDAAPDGGLRRRPGRPKVAPDAAQATAITRKAAELFMARGYGQTTMEDIVAACRISKRTLYRLFPSKADVFGAVISEHRQSMLALPGDYDDCSIQEALERIFRIDIDDQANAERLALLRFAIVEARHFPELHALLIKHGPELSRSDLSQWLAAQASRGRIACDNPYDTAKAIMDMMFGVSVRNIDGTMEWPEFEERARYLRNCIDLVTKGLTPRQSEAQR
jgi:AcrR family transcriptional regulator